MKKTFFFFLSLPLFITAQINESDTLKLKADLSLTGFWQSGNVETLIFRANSNFSWQPVDKLVFKTKNSYVYQAFDKKKADEDILSLNFLYFNPQRKIYPQVLGFVSTNFRREIDLRTLFGAGVTIQLLNEKKHWLKVSVTSEYERTNFKQADFNRNEYDGDNSIDTFRGTLWINGKYHLFKGRVILTHESFYQPSLERSDNYRYRADLGLELPIWKFLNFKVNYLHTYESLVIADQELKDQFLTFGFTLKSY